MTSKNLFFKLMKEDLKRRLWAVALLSLGFFFFYPVVAAFTAGEIKEYTDYARGLAKYEDGLVRWLSFNSGMTVFLMMLSALICGLSSFSYLNSKKQVDFYHGIPVRREKLFAANFLNGILILAVPYGICQILAVLVGIANGAGSGRLWQVALAAYGLHMTYFILMYTTVVVAAMMTGHLLVGFLGAMVLESYMPVAMGIFVGYLTRFFRTYASNLPGLLSEDVLMYGIRMSPAAEYIYQLARNGEQYNVPVPMAAPVLAAWAVSILLTALACVLYRKRPSEAAGKAMAFSVTCPVIRILLTVVSALGLGIFFHALRDSMGWAVFGIICGGGICHCVVEIIYHFDFRKLFSHKLQLVGCLGASIAILAVFRYDLLGYDRYLPKEGQVREAAVLVEQMTDWVSYGYSEQMPDGHYEWNYGSVCDEFQNMEYHDIENLLSIAAEGIERVEENKKRGNYWDSRYDNGLEDAFPEERLWSQVTVCYTLNSGRKVSRVYHMPIDGKIRPAMERLYENEEFQKGIFPVMTMTGEQVDSVHVRGKYSRNDKNEVVLNKLSDGEKKRMLETYQKEFAAMTMERMEREAPVGLIRFSKEIDEEAVAWWKKQEASQFEDYPGYRYRGWRDLVNKDFYPVYPSFTETIGLLEKQGVEMEGYLDDLDVRAIQVRPLVDHDLYDDREWSSKEYDDGWKYFYINDSEEIRELRKVLIYDNLCYYDPFFRSEENVEINLMVWNLEEDEADRSSEEYEDGNWNDSVRVLIPEGQAPKDWWER